MTTQQNTTTEPTTGVTGDHTTDGIPHGLTSLTPFIAVPNAKQAIEFYTSVFGARLVDATEFSGVVVHADLDFGTHLVRGGEQAPSVVQLRTDETVPNRVGGLALRALEQSRAAIEAGAIVTISDERFRVRHLADPSE